eukprot:1184535-Prorocentrum_minimum.AAC.4
MQLQQWSKQWDLPSLAPACTHVEAYLRFADIAFTVLECESVVTSPSGVLPTLDTSEEVIGPGKEEQTIDGEDASRRIIEHLRKVKDLDAGLTQAHFGEVQAFTELVKSKLVPATIYFTFMDPIMFKKHSQGAYAATLPIPLNRITPWRWRKSISKTWGTLTVSQVMANVEMVYGIINNRLETTGGRDYFVAGRPTSIDALLYSHLNYHRYAPVGESDLRPLLAKYSAIGQYLDFIRSKHWAGAPKPPPVFETTAEEKREAAAVRVVEQQSWSSWLWGSGNPKPKRTEKEIRFKRRSQMFMAFMASAVAVYVLLSEVAEISFTDEDEEEDSDYEEETDE